MLSRVCEVENCTRIVHNYLVDTCYYHLVFNKEEE